MGPPADGGTCNFFGPEQPVALDDASWGYSAQNVLDAVNNSAVGDLVWLDGTKTKLHFSVQATDTGAVQGGEVEVSNPTSNEGCARAMVISISANVVTDDGRFDETVGGTVSISDSGAGQLDLDQIAVNLALLPAPESATAVATIGDGGTHVPPPPPALTGTAGAVIPPLAGVPANQTVQFLIELVVKGATCSRACAPGQPPSGAANDPCYPPSGRITMEWNSTDPNRSFPCIANSVHVAAWQWE
ncbi:MAG TPA: hypothetical protein VFG23_02175 [Polyangia bacterium]|nr:hypothetical protein [Polyangia bacterium]